MLAGKCHRGRARIIGRAVALLCLVAVATTAISARAYVPTRTQRSGMPIRWHDTNCVLIRPHLLGSSAVNDGSEFTALLRAIDNWHRATADCSYLRFRAANPLSHADPGFVRGELNENVVHYVERGWAHDAAATALTTVKFLSKPDHPADGRILDADIEMNGELYSFGTDGDEATTDIENTLTHELGHVIGLDHPCDDGTYGASPPADDQGLPIPDCALAPATMQETTMFNFADPGETKKRSPEADDVRGFCATYPIEEDPRRCAVLAVELEGGCGVEGRPSRGRRSWPLLPLLALLGLLLARRGLRC